jgi:hypothetical protein
MTRFNTRVRSDDNGGCYVCHFLGERFGRPFCDLHRIVPSLPKDGCPSRQRAPGSDDEQFWKQPDPRTDAIARRR